MLSRYTVTKFVNETKEVHVKCANKLLLKAIITKQFKFIIIEIALK